MIEFGLTEDQTLVVEMAKNFAARELRPHIRAAEHDGVSSSVQVSAKAAGLAELWAGDVDMLTRCLAAEELAYGDAGAMLALVAPAIAASAAARLGVTANDLDAVHIHEGVSPNEIAWLPIRAVGSEPRAKILQVHRNGAWRVIVAKLEPIATLGLHAAGGCKCTMIDRIALGDAGERGALAVAEVRLAVAAMSVGVARASLEYVENYVQERVTFGKKLSEHQAIAFMIADVALAISAARMLVYRGALGLTAGETAGAAHAYVEATTAALFATDRGVQMLGGHGYLKDHPVEKFMRDARSLALFAGGRDIASDDSESDALENRWT